jgi:hypothetical protein
MGKINVREGLTLGSLLGSLRRMSNQMVDYEDNQDHCLRLLHTMAVQVERP